MCVVNFIRKIEFFGFPWFGFEFNNYQQAEWGGGVAEHVVGRFVNQPGNGLKTEQIYH